MVSLFPRQPGSPHGGVEAAAEILANALAKTGKIDLHIVSFSQNIQAHTESRPGYTVHWLPKPHLPLPGFLAYWTTQRQAIHKKLTELQPDVAHFQAAAGWTLGYTKPFVLTIHGIIENDVLHSQLPLKRFRSWLMHQVESYARRLAHRLIVINPYVVNLLGDQLNQTQYFIENPVADEYFDIHRTANNHNVLCISRVIQRKNIDGLIRAFAIVKNNIPEAKLLIAGPCEDATYLQYCIDLVRQLRIESAVDFLGAKDRNSIAALLASAGCLALVSFQETAPIVLAEALAAGIPVVTSNRCGMPFMVDQGQTGWLVNPNDTNAIANHLIEALNTHNIDASYAYQRFNSLSVAEKTIQAYYDAQTDA